MLTNHDIINIMKRVLQKICVISRNPLSDSCRESGSFNHDGVLARWPGDAQYDTPLLNRDIWEAAPIVHLGKIYIKITYGNFDEIHIDPTTAANYAWHGGPTTGGPMVPVALPEA